MMAHVAWEYGQTILVERKEAKEDGGNISRNVTNIVSLSVCSLRAGLLRFFFFFFQPHWLGELTSIRMP